LILVGNKSDLNGERTVSYEEAQRLAQSIGATFVETSAKCGDNIQNVLPLCLTAIDFNASGEKNPNKTTNDLTNNKQNPKCTIS
jgi:Ras-related protein Rab-21